MMIYPISGQQGVAFIRSSGGSQIEIVPTKHLPWAVYKKVIEEFRTGVALYRYGILYTLLLSPSIPSHIYLDINRKSLRADNKNLNFVLGEMVACVKTANKNQSEITMFLFFERVEEECALIYVNGQMRAERMQIEHKEKFKSQGTCIIT